jgi:hypothetical protein
MHDHRSVRGLRTATIEGTGTAAVEMASARETGTPATVGRPTHWAGESRGALADTSAREGAPAPAAVEQALTLVFHHAAAAYDTPGGWETRIRAALSALLDLFDQQPELARLCVVQCDHAGPAVLATREEILTQFASRIDDGRRHAQRQPPAHAAQAVLAGALGAVRARLIHAGPAGMRELLEPLMGFIVLPYRGAAASRLQLARPSALL